MIKVHLFIGRQMNKFDACVEMRIETISFYGPFVRAGLWSTGNCQDCVRMQIVKVPVGPVSLGAVALMI